MSGHLTPVLALLACLVATSGAAVEFAGYVKAGSEAQVVLMDRATGQVSELLGVGGSFAGHRVTAFDAKTETLTLEKDGAVVRLGLKSAARQSLAQALAGLPPLVRPEAEAGIIKQLDDEIRRKIPELEKRRAELRRQLAEGQKAGLAQGDPEMVSSRAGIIMAEAELTSILSGDLNKAQNLNRNLELRIKVGTKLGYPDHDPEMAELRRMLEEAKAEERRLEERIKAIEKDKL